MRQSLSDHPSFQMQRLVLQRLATRISPLPSLVVEFAEVITSSNKGFNKISYTTTLQINWGHYAREASTLCYGFIEFLQKQAQVEASTQRLLSEKMNSLEMEYSQRFPKNITGLHSAAYFGVEAVGALLLDRFAAGAGVSGEGWVHVADLSAL